MKTTLAIATALAVSATLTFSQTSNSPGIELLPRPALYIATQHGEAKSATVEIVNHEHEPMDILQVDHSNAWFITSLQTNKPGYRYNLSLTVRSNAPAGKQCARITIKTSSRKQPFLTMLAHALVRHRVYSFPDAIDFGAIRRSKVLRNPSLVPFLTQTVTVYQHHGTHFKVRAKSSLDCLSVASEPSKAGDRTELTVQVLAERLKLGELIGTITINSNDAQYPTLRIPVHGTVVD